MQIMVWAVIWITSIKIWYISNIFGGIIDLETYFFILFWVKVYLIPLAFTIIWYVLIFNALNWSDGVPWLTSWISTVSFFIIFLLSYILFVNDTYLWGIKNAEFTMNISLILLGTLLVFFFFDSREKLLMWDSWTMFLGFMLASLAIIAGWKVATILSVFGIYVIDAFYVIYNRIKNKKSPMNKDTTHLHHRLLNYWFSAKQVIAFVVVVALSFWVSALFLDKIWKIIVFVIIFLVVVWIDRRYKKD